MTPLIPLRCTTRRRLRASFQPAIVFLLAAVAILCLLAAARPIEPVVILVPSSASELETLAAREIRRYVYLRTGAMLPIAQTDGASSVAGPSILVATRGAALLRSVSDPGLTDGLDALVPQSFVLKSIGGGDRSVLVIAGGDGPGTLYGAYRFAEHLGIRFYPDGDVVPDGTVPLNLDGFDEFASPDFELRGIQPFHDFPEGPDWWNLDDYKAIIAQLAKMRMNFIGFHTYPEMVFGGWARAEPIVWIGTKEQVLEDGTVTAAYPALHSNTGDSTWGYGPGPTSDFCCGAAQLFDTDVFGADYMKNVTPWPHTPAENVQLFNTVGSLQKDAFTFARRLGVKTTIGTETPLTIPAAVRSTLEDAGLDPDSEEARLAVYEGLFTRINRQHPLDFYWFWTPEGWTWEGTTDEAIDRTLTDLRIAGQAAARVGAPFTLATAGWVLGPPRDRTEFDRVLPKDMPFSTINRIVGFAPVEPGFEAIRDRPKWAIPWLEDDPALTSPQLWVGRVRKDALDAYRYGVTGLMGIHWRTRVLSPNFGALAQSGWQAPRPTGPEDLDRRHLASLDFYRDWAAAQFGPGVAAEAASIFAALDGGEGEYHGHFYRTSAWVGTGPGTVIVNPEPWSEVGKSFEFVDRFAALEPHVEGVSNRERFTYWLETFRYARSMARVGCLLGEVDTTMKRIDAHADLAEKRRLAREKVLPLREEIRTHWEEMVTHLLNATGTMGELGTLTNLELRSLRGMRLVSRTDSTLTAALGEPVPRFELTRRYRGHPRLIVPTVRSVLESGEDLRLRVLVLSNEPVVRAEVVWGELGEELLQTEPLRHVARGVYEAVISGDRMGGEDIAYVVEVELAGGPSLTFPASGASRPQTVVVFPRDGDR